MHISFKTKALTNLYNTGRSKNYPDLVIASFFRVMAIISSVNNEGGLYGFEQLHYHKLLGARGKAGDRALDLWDGWRLIVRVNDSSQEHELLVIEISNHYG
ncbi:MAG: hypothetical protein ACYC6L_06780 [Anaerolineae bacterium]